MKRVRISPLTIGTVLTLAFLVSVARGQEGGNGLERFRQLAGEWVGTAQMGDQRHDATVKYQVSSAGKAVLETLFPGTPHEMLTVVHQDGPDLGLTHFCHLGNQPNMKTKGVGEGNQVAFKFNSASNMKSEQDAHMHEVTYTFVDKDTLKAEWVLYRDGKPAGTVVLDLKRKQ